MESNFWESLFRALVRAKKAEEASFSFIWLLLRLLPLARRPV